MAREKPQSGVGCISTSLNVGNDIVGNKPRHPELDSVDVGAVARINQLSDVGRIGTSLDVGNDIGSRIEQHKVDEPINLGNETVPTSLRCTVSTTRRQQRLMATARRKASVMSQSDMITTTSCIHSLME